MEVTLDGILFALMGLIQLLGVAGLVVSRVGEKSGRVGACQLFFFATLLAVASATMALLFMGDGGWAISGTTLSLMVVGGTLDCGGWNRIGPCN